LLILPFLPRREKQGKKKKEKKKKKKRAAAVSPNGEFPTAKGRCEYQLVILNLQFH